MSQWSERQQAMLREMGVRLWLPPAVLPTEASPTLGTGDHTDPAGGVMRNEIRPHAAAEVSTPPRARSPSESGAEAPRRIAPAAAAEIPLRALQPGPAVPAIPGDVAGLDWDALQARVEQCHACALARSRHQVVFGVGHRQARWMLVGEAPGEQEDLRGEPFVGKAGQLLDNMLRAVGLTRSEAPPEQQVYIANVLKCRPPGNRNPDPAEVQQCVPYLQRQIELVQPRLILALGRFAVQSLLGTAEPIGRLRGKVHQHQGIPVVVSYHPAYLLRNPLDKARSWEDLCLAAQVYLQGDGNK